MWAKTPDSLFFPPENGNRYEGNWQRGMKNGWGRFFHLDHGQLFEGLWVDNIAKCGTMIDCGRDEAPKPTQFPIPEVGSSPGSWGHMQPRERQNSTHSHTQPVRAQPGQETDEVLFSVRATPGRLAVPPQSRERPKGWQPGASMLPKPTPAASLQVKILDPDDVLAEALATFKKTQEEGD